MGWGGREVPEGGDICVFVADSHCYTAEAAQHSKAIILQLRTKIFLKESRNSEWVKG